MLIMGIDPGFDGALAVIDAGTGALRVFDMPTFALKRGGKNKREIDVAGLANLIAADRHPGHAFIEQVGAMPGQGVSGVFAFGKSYGIVIGVLAARGVPVTFVNPRVWKKALGVPAAKDGARARASQLLPGNSEWWPLVKHDGRAESALIALWGTQQFNSIGTTASARSRELTDLFAGGAP